MSERAVAIITGGSAGYGAGIAEVFRDDGIEVFITRRDREEVEATASCPQHLSLQEAILWPRAQEVEPL